MARQISVADETEELVALRAVETFRALRRAVADAPHGRGLAAVEAVVRDRGFEQLARMYQAAVREHPEAKKKAGPAAGRAARAAGPRASAGRRPSTS
jgi:hypothetical protein